MTEQSALQSSPKPQRFDTSRRLSGSRMILDCEYQYIHLRAATWIQGREPWHLSAYLANRTRLELTSYCRQMVWVEFQPHLNRDLLAHGKRLVKVRLITDKVKALNRPSPIVDVNYFP